jgi:hypothetical protein
MVQPVLFYISAASDLEAEREVLGRAVTEIPVDLAWRVVQSPGGNGPVDLDAIADADVHILLMGSDIRAPVGLEWQVARQTGQQPRAFLRQDALRTPAGQAFVRLVREAQGWEGYPDLATLRRTVLRLLADHVMEHAIRYALRPEELVRLQSWRNSLAQSADEVDEETRGGAGDSSVLLSRERFEPSGGILIGGGQANAPTDRREGA